jgi:hypothetical protein
MQRADNDNFGRNLELLPVKSRYLLDLTLIP